MRRKEIFIVVMLMFALVIAGCGEKNESDVTIIGGADGCLVPWDGGLYLSVSSSSRLQE